MVERKAAANLSSVSKNCPVCGASIAKSAVFCVKCGHDLRKESAFFAISSGRMRTVQTVLFVSFVAVCASLLFSFFQKNNRPRNAVSLVSERPARSNQNAVVEEEPPSDLPSVSNRATVLETTRVAQTDLSNAVPPNATALEKSGSSEQAFRQEIIRKLDEKYPLFSVEEAVALRRNNGMVNRGAFAGVEGDKVVLVQKEERVLIPLTALDRVSRLRCDAAFRERLVEKYVKKQMKKVNNF